MYSTGTAGSDGTDLQARDTAGGRSRALTAVRRLGSIRAPGETHEKTATVAPHTRNLAEYSSRHRAIRWILSQVDLDGLYEQPSQRIHDYELQDTLGLV